MINGGGIKPRVLICIITRGRHAPVMHCPVYNADNKSAISPNNTRRVKVRHCWSAERVVNGRLPAGVSLNLSALRDVADVTGARTRPYMYNSPASSELQKISSGQEACMICQHENAAELINVKRWQWLDTLPGGLCCQILTKFV